MRQCSNISSRTTSRTGLTPTCHASAKILKAAPVCSTEFARFSEGLWSRERDATSAAGPGRQGTRERIGASEQRKSGMQRSLVLRMPPCSPKPCSGAPSASACGPLAVVLELRRRLQLILGCVHRRAPHLVVCVIADRQRVRIDRDIMGSHAEESADAENVPYHFLRTVDGDVLDLADVVVLLIVNVEPD